MKLHDRQILKFNFIYKKMKINFQINYKIKFK